MGTPIMMENVKVDLDKLALMFNEKPDDEVVLVEVHVLKRDAEGRVHRQSITIDYDSEDDYQWSTSSRMIG
jgi:hypothetical protein